MNWLETLTLALIPGTILVDLLWRQRSYASPYWWPARAALVSVAIFYFTGYVAEFWGWLLGDFQLLHLDGLGAGWGAVVGVLVYQFVHYGYHRAAHDWNWLWRASHQMHHSAESLDALGAFYQHPLDAALFTTWASLVFFPLLGLSTDAAILATLFLVFNAMFQHANIATPHWLGYLVQRPESHNIHHARGVHYYNFADLPLIDMLFGTFRNPREDTAPACGFYEGASARIPEMLMGRDVAEPRPDRQAASGTTVGLAS